MTPWFCKTRSVQELDMTSLIAVVCLALVFFALVLQHCNIDAHIDDANNYNNTL